MLSIIDRHAGKSAVKRDGPFSFPQTLLKSRVMKKYLTGALDDGTNGFWNNWVRRHAGRFPPFQFSALFFCIPLPFDLNGVSGFIILLCLYSMLHKSIDKISYMSQKPQGILFVVICLCVHDIIAPVIFE